MPYTRKSEIAELEAKIKALEQLEQKELEQPLPAPVLATSKPVSDTFSEEMAKAKAASIRNSRARHSSTPGNWEGGPGPIWCGMNDETRVREDDWEVEYYYV